MFKSGTVVTAVTPVGEFIGKFVEFSNGILTLEKPKGVGQTQEGIGLMDGVCVSGKPRPEKVQFMNVVLITDSNTEIANGYLQSIGGILTPPSIGNIDMSKLKLS
jgi:hypothetical protein